MMRNLAAAIALATLSACAGSYTPGSTMLNPPDGSGIAVSPDGGDGGADGGADGGGDAGPDAGCVAVSLSGLAVVDGCVNPATPETGFATISVTDAGQGCAVSITLTTSMAACNGVASGGTANAFTGTCSSIPCTSPSLPGTLTCSSGSPNCTIQICDAGTCP